MDHIFCTSFLNYPIEYHQHSLLQIKRSKQLTLLFSRSSWPGGGAVRDHDSKNQSYHHPIEMKFSMNHQSNESMHDARLESGSCSTFENTTPQNFPLKKRKSLDSDIYPLWV